ncbi:hypothetical protein SARC_11754, partial [Sphaeroforma arctica JP610]
MERAGMDDADPQGFHSQCTFSYDQDVGNTLGEYFLRLNGVGEGAQMNMQPSLLMTYTLEGSTEVAGNIYDIDGDEATGREDQFKVTAFNAAKQEIGSQLSPRASTADCSANVWKSHPWEFLITTTEIIRYVRIDYVGSGVHGDVNFGVDNIRAFGCSDDTTTPSQSASPSFTPSVTSSTFVASRISGVITEHVSGTLLEGVPVAIQCATDSNLNVVLTTDSNGAYLLEDAPDCAYMVYVPLVANDVSGFPKVTVYSNSSVDVLIDVDTRVGVADFEYIVLGAISGYTLNDFDQSPIPDVTVTLECSGITEQRQTDAEGYYLFDLLPECVYTVSVPTMVEDDWPIMEGPIGGSSPLESHEVEIEGVNRNFTHVDFKYLPQGTIAGVLRDFVTKEPIVGEDVTITCLEDESITFTMATDSNGAYEFIELGYCIYAILAPQQVTAVGPIYLGPVDEEDDLFITTKVIDENIRAHGGVDFEYTTLGSISGHIIEWDLSSPAGIENVPINLVCSVNENITFTTNSSGVLGDYEVTDMPVCTYIVTVPEVVDGLPIFSGYDGDDTLNVADVILTINSPDKQNVDFYYYLVPSPSPSATPTGSASPTASTSASPSTVVPATIFGMVIEHTSLTPLEGVTVTLTCPADPSLDDTTVTGVNGTYSFVDVDDCEYIVGVPMEVENVSGFTKLDVFTSFDVAVEIDDNARTGQANFEFIPLGTISGFTLNDFDDYAIADVPVNLVCTELGLSVNKNTDSNGFYEFTDLEPCDYVVSVPSSVDSVGPIVFGPMDNDTLLFSHEVEISDSVREVTDRTFKYLPQGTIAGKLFDFVPGTGIENATVSITCAETDVTITNVTNAAGEYEFTNLPFCDYLVVAPTSVDTAGPIYTGPLDGPVDGTNPLHTTTVVINSTILAVGDVDFSYTQVATISGHTYEDIDTAIPDVFVTIICTEAPSIMFTTETGINGQYIFADVPMCDYLVYVPDIANEKPIVEGYGSSDPLNEAMVFPTIQEPVVEDVDFIYRNPPSSSPTASGSASHTPSATPTTSPDGICPGVCADNCNVECDITCQLLGIQYVEDGQCTHLTGGANKCESGLECCMCTGEDASPSPTSSQTASQLPIPSPTPSATVTASPSATETASPSATVTTSASVTPSASALGDCIHGIVKDLTTLEPLSNTAVFLTCDKGFSASTVTDENGEYVFYNVPEEDSCEVSISEGGDSVDLDVNDSQVTCVEPSPSPSSSASVSSSPSHTASLT